jgi:hypothetical protein
MILTATLLQLCLYAPSSSPASQAAASELSAAPCINTWLVLGTFDNDAGNSGFDRDWLGEASVQPPAAVPGVPKSWRYFDDRLFSRNYDDYQDLFSYFRIKLEPPLKSVAAKVAYAHVYIHSEQNQNAQLRIGADNEFKAWVNGSLIASHTQAATERDQIRSEVRLETGWNRLLLKIANQEDGRLGFYAKICDAQGRQLPGLTFSPEGGTGKLACSVPEPPGEYAGKLPAAYRQWPYVQANAMDVANPQYGPLRKPPLAMQSSPYILTAHGGTPPYRWSLLAGKLPAGLQLSPDGTIRGTVAPGVTLEEHPFSVRVTDTTGAIASQRLRIPVKERPNKWYEEARLTALIHCPESAPAGELADFAQLMKRQGYSLGMIISYNNGDHAYRWPSVFDPNNTLGDVAARYKSALEAEGLYFGMYIGNFDGENHGGRNGAILVLDDLMRRYKPAAIWFDWAGWDGFALDAMFSVIRSYNPDTLIVLNGVPTMSNGDWDVLVLEGWGAWGNQMWNVWPAPVVWPKYPVLESWRLVADPVFDYTKDIQPDWQEYLRVQISLICEGYVANIDHSPTIRQKINSLNESVVMQCHQRMADWANPPGAAAPLYRSYTHVYPGPFDDQAWGYSTISTDRNTIYLHMLANPFGKNGVPADRSVTVGPITTSVRQVKCMNQNAPLNFRLQDSRLSISLADVTPDQVDTIIQIDLAERYPDTGSTAQRILRPTPPGNLATGKPAFLLSAAGDRLLPPSGFSYAYNGVDGRQSSFAQAGGEWAWNYEVDLQDEHRVNRVVIHFGSGFATQYELLLSKDDINWSAVASITDGQGGTREHAFAPMPARYVRIRAIKPDAPNQPGIQMSIAELEVYETRQP